MDRAQAQQTFVQKTSAAKPTRPLDEDEDARRRIATSSSRYWTAAAVQLHQSFYGEAELAALDEEIRKRLEETTNEGGSKLHLQPLVGQGTAAGEGYMYPMGEAAYGRPGKSVYGSTSRLSKSSQQPSRNEQGANRWQVMRAPAKKRVRVREGGNGRETDIVELIQRDVFQSPEIIPFGREEATQCAVRGSKAVRDTMTSSFNVRDTLQ
ncbi:hypothetical protein BV20DRAFT_982668 [Pilatotrama ljubarskyi]|nr:hypothetical protein BV20DRAFT_982668 [Pilatotrama ljubarskyi]